MNQVKDINYELAFLSWAKTKYYLSKDSVNQEILLKNLINLEEYLSHSGIEKISVLYQSTSFFTIEYYKDGSYGIIDFPSNKVHASKDGTFSTISDWT